MIAFRFYLVCFFLYLLVTVGCVQQDYLDNFNKGIPRVNSRLKRHNSIDFFKKLEGIHSRIRRQNDGDSGEAVGEHSNEETTNGPPADGDLVSCQITCPAGWSSFQESCYFLHTHDKYDWMESRGYCGIHNAHLATIESVEESNFIKNLTSKYLTGQRGANVWVGATDDMNEGDFRWTATDSALTFTDWYPGEPNSIPLHLREDCLALWYDYQWQWADYDCHSQCYYICEKSPGNFGLVG